MKPKSNLPTFPLDENVLQQNNPIEYKFPSNYILPRGYDYCFSLSYVASRKSANPLAYPMITVTVNAIKYHNLLQLNGSKTTMKMCFSDFAAKDIQNILFHFEAYPHICSVKVLSIDFLMEPIKMVSQVDFPTKIPADECNHLVQLLEYDKFTRGFEQSSDHIVKLNNEKRLFIENSGHMSARSLTLISTWLRLHNVKSPFSIPLSDSSECSQNSTYSILSAGLLYFDDTNRTEMINLTATVTQNQFMFDIPSNLPNNSTTLFKIVIEFITTCHKLILRPINIHCTDEKPGQIDPCSNFPSGTFSWSSNISRYCVINLKHYIKYRCSLSQTHLVVFLYTM